LNCAAIVSNGGGRARGLQPPVPVERGMFAARRALQDLLSGVRVAGTSPRSVPVSEIGSADTTGHQIAGPASSNATSRREKCLLSCENGDFACLHSVEDRGFAKSSAKIPAAAPIEVADSFRWRDARFRAQIQEGLAAHSLAFPPRPPPAPLSWRPGAMGDGVGRAGPAIRRVRRRGYRRPR